MDYQTEIVNYFNTRFLSSMDIWARGVIRTLNEFQSKKKIAASINYDFIIAKLKKHIDEYELILEETYEDILDKSERYNVDLHAEELIPVSIWVLVEDRVDFKLTNLFKKIETALQAYNADFEAYPLELQDLLEDLKAILKITSDSIWRLLNGVFHDEKE